MYSYETDTPSHYIVTGSVSAQISPGILPIQITSFDCDGSESRLTSCSYVSSTSSCTHSNDLGIHCLPGKHSCTVDTCIPLCAYSARYYLKHCIQQQKITAPALPLHSLMCGWGYSAGRWRDRVEGEAGNMLQSEVGDSEW